MVACFSTGKDYATIVTGGDGGGALLSHIVETRDSLSSRQEKATTLFMQSSEYGVLTGGNRGREVPTVHESKVRAQENPGSSS